MIFYDFLIDQCSFRYTTTDNNIGEDTSTICDESTINGDDEAPDDASSANGSVINVKANFTKMSAEAWLSSIDKEKKKRKEGKSQRQLKSKSALLSGSSEESMASKSGTLTRQLLKAHDHAHVPIVRHGLGFGDEESSVYSVDQEGFYTSMHKDSGLKHAFADLILEEDVFTSSTLIDCNQPDKKEKRKSLVGSGKKRGSKKSKKTPPPPPQRASSTLSKSNLTLHMDDSEPTSPTQIDSSMDRSRRAGSNDTTISEHSNNSKNKHYESASESDAEAIYARIKVKSSISAAAIPSLCSVTPLNSDEEDMDMLAFSSTWRPNGTVSSADTSTWTPKSTPDFRPTIQGNHFTSTPNANQEQRLKVADFSLTFDPTLSSFSITSMTKDDSFTETEKAADSSLNLSDYSNGCSTWPRSPNSKADSTLFGSLLKTVEKKPPRPQISQMFNSPDHLNINVGDRAVTGSFKGSNDGSIGPSSSKSGGSGSTTTLSSIPSSTSDEQPNIPDKYKPSLSVKPRARSSERTKSISVPEPIREHVYANVIIQDTPTTSGVQTVSITKNTSHYATSSVVAKAEPKVSTSTFTSSPYSVGGLTSSEASKSVPSRSANAPTTTAITSPASSGPPSRALSPTGKVYAVPVPAPAKLIISSPVSGQISFKENPYKRSVCSPVSAEELLTNWNTPVKERDKCYNSLPRKPNSPSGPGAAKQQSTLNLSPDKKDNVSPFIITNQDFEYSTLPKKRLGGAFDHIHCVSAAGTPMSPPPSQPLFPSISAMKHSVSFPVTEKEVSQQKKPQEDKPTKESKSTTYGGSWYDGIKTDTKKPTGMPNSDSFNSISCYMSAPSRSCFSPNRNSADSFTFGQRRDSIASTISTDSSGRSKTGFLSSILKASPSGSKTSVRTDEDTVSIASSRSDEKQPTFSSFTKPPNLGLSLSIKRTAGVGSQGSEGSGKGIVPAVPPVIPSSASTIAASNTQPISRPTSLAISPTTEIGTKRTRLPDQCTDQQDGQTEAKALHLTTIKENETPKSTRPPRRSPVRVVYPASPTKTQKSPSPEAGPSFGKPKTTVIVSAQNKRGGSPPTRPTSAKIETTHISWPSKNDNKPTEGENRKSVLSSFAPMPVSNSGSSNSTVETTKSGVPSPPTRESSLPRKSTLKQSVIEAVSSVSTDGQSTVVSSTSGLLTNGVSSVTSNTVTVPNVTKTVSTHASSAVASNKNDKDNSNGLPRYPVFVKPKTNNTFPSKPLSLYVGPSSDNKNVPSGDTNAQASSKPRSESVSSNESSSASRPTNLDNMSISNLNRSTGSLASGLSVLSSSNTNLNKSSLSLYKSSESLASINSNHAEKTRAAKLAFLSGGGSGDSNTKGPQSADPFARFKVNGRKSSTGSTVSSSSIRSITSNGHVENTNNSNSESSENSTPTHKLRQSPSQGRFVASKIELLRRKSVDTPPPSPESPSSGLGSSICSPLSPVKSPPTVGTIDFTNLNGHQTVVNNNCKSMIHETQIESVIS